MRTSFLLLMTPRLDEVFAQINCKLNFFRREISEIDFLSGGKCLEGSIITDEMVNNCNHGNQWLVIRNGQ